MSNFTYDDRTPMRNHLAELRAAAEAAGQRFEVVAARAKNRDGVAEAEREVLAELRKFRDDADFRLRERGTDDEEDAGRRAITERIVAAVLDRGLVFDAVPGERQRGVLIVDPSIWREYRDADAEAKEANAAATRFEEENHAALIEEADAVQKDDFARAISESDTEAVAGMITLTQQAQRRREQADAAMTTRDLPQSGAPIRRHQPI